VARIDSTEALRRIIPEAGSSTYAKILPALDEEASRFVRDCAFCLLATIDADGRIEVSPKGDERGFIAIEDERTLLMPERAGNNLAFGLKNIIANGRIGLILLVPNTGETLRLSGHAEVRDDPELIARFSSRGRPAPLVTRIHIEHCYFHCARALLRSKLWEPADWLPKRRILFGQLIASRTGGDAALARAIDEDVELAYTRNLWCDDPAD
jgi:hypothetical protein